MIEPANQQKSKFSFEFFPPRTAVGTRRFWRAIGQLETCNPAFFSVTYGALGSGQQQSLTTVEEVVREIEVPVAAHLTFEGATIDETHRVAEHFHELGVKRIVALRGDARQDAIAARQRGPCYNNVAEMIVDLKRQYNFDFSVACYPEVHPQAKSAAADMAQLQAKSDAGAARAISQFFFDADDFLRFRDRARKLAIEIPLVAGILPIRDFDRVLEFSKKCGARVPEALQQRYAQQSQSPEARQRFARDEMEHLILQLQQEGCTDFHVYALNQPVDCKLIRTNHCAKVEQQGAVAA